MVFAPFRKLDSKDLILNHYPLSQHRASKVVSKRILTILIRFPDESLSKISCIVRRCNLADSTWKRSSQFLN